MVDTSLVNEAGGKIVDRIFSGFTFIFIILILGTAIVGILLYVRYLRQFNVKVEIKSLRGSGTQGEPVYKIVSDKGAMILNKKDKRHYFRIHGEKVDLPPPPLDCLELTANGTNQVRIFQKSQDEYFYLLPDRVDVNWIIKDGKRIPIGQAKLNVVEGDISYWNTLKKRDNRKLFDTESFVTKFLPYVGIFLMFMAVIFLTYMITDHWGTFEQAASHLREAAQALKDTTVAGTATETGVG